MPTSRTPDHPTGVPKLTVEDETLHASPSKSRAAAETARNWSTVTAWLTKLLAPSPIPAFERNDATLNYLLSLIHANDTADTERALLHQARQEALDELESRPSNLDPDPITELLLEIENSLSLTAQSNVESLASTAVTLGTLPPHTPSSLASALHALTHSTFASYQQTTRLTTLQHTIATQIVQTQAAISSLAPDDEATAALRAEAALWARETKHLGLKAAEYRHQISSSATATLPAGVRYEDVQALEADVAALRREVERLESQVRTYHGLPADVEVAREEVRRAQGELGALERRREELFGRMVER